MGMAASQARFLGLTARKSNIEFEGQQINQERTTLSNQSANYYTSLLGMEVPTAPSVDDYTTTVYTFEDGSLSNTITALIANGNGYYTVSYLRSWDDDYSVVAASTSIISETDPDYKYTAALSYINEITKTTDTDGEESYKIGDLDLTLTQLSSLSDEELTNLASTLGIDIAYLNYLTKDDSDNDWYIGYTYDESTGEYSTYFYKGAAIDELEHGEDGTTNVNAYEVTSSSTSYSIGANTLRNMAYYINGEYRSSLYLYDDDGNFLGLNSDLIDNDAYLSTLTEDQIAGLVTEELAYIQLLNDKYGSDGSEYYVRYVQDTTTGEYVPYFYKVSDVESASYSESTGASLSNIACYTVGTETKQEEVKAVEECKVEKDSTGRYISISIPDEDGNYTTYSLTTTTTTDQDAYEDAMNQYEYDKYEYDQTITEINAKIEIVQAEDKELELRLKQLDTEQDAVQTEIDSVSKVIEKNVESSFKTFA